MLIILIKTIIIVLLVFFVLRLMGKRQIGEMQPFELVITLILAEVACLPMNDPGIPLYSGIVPIVVLAFLHIMFTFFSQKSLRFRKLFDGRGVIVIDRGVIVFENLRKMNMNMNDLLEAARTGGFTDLMDIEYAIFETTGRLSVVEKPAGGGKALLPLPLVIDGTRVEKNFVTSAINEVQLNKFMREQGIDSLGDIAYLDVRQDGIAYASLKSGKSLQGRIKTGGKW